MEKDGKRLRVPLLYWIPILFCGAMLFFADVFEMQFFTIKYKPIFRNVSFEDRSLKGFTISTPGCKIPYMDPFDYHVKKFIKQPEKPKCNNGKPPLFASNLTSVYLLTSSLAEYQITNISELKCCYKAFRRIPPQKGEADNKVQYAANCYEFEESTETTEEFIQITCTYDNITIYNDMFSFVPLRNNSKDKADSKRLNILIVGLDSISRLNLQRQMPKTVKYLNEQEAVELLGYNKVGDNTFPNLMPVLTGFSYEELRNICWPSDNEYFDDCPFIWNLYKQKGYSTAFGEDAAWMGIFNYNKKGFQKQPTDYAYSYFSRIIEETIGNYHMTNNFLCEGSRYIYKDLLDYITKFAKTMRDNNSPHFGFFWGASLSHDNLNMPNIGDQDYYLFFKQLLEGNILENTVLIFMSDHGIRWGDIRLTFQGMMEERLPFVYLLLPKFFQEKYYTAFLNLKINKRRLTTPFDLHETLLDLANPSDLLIEKNLVNTNQSRRGISLFRTINKRRRCEDAGIASHWCTCQQTTEINITSQVTKAAHFAVDNINNELKGYAQCTTLSLDTVIRARVMGSEFPGSHKISDYMLTFQTVPNNAVFEATVRFIENKNSFEVIGTISRLNLYGNQSACITDFHLKLFCFCKYLLH